jgi:hypothetical protein
VWACGKPQWATAASLSKLATMAVLLPLGYRIGSGIDPAYAFPGAILGFSLADASRYAVSGVGCARLGLRAWGSDAELTGLLVLSGGAGLASATWLHRRDASDLTVALAIAAIVTLFWAPYARHAIGGRRGARRSPSGSAP